MFANKKIVFIGGVWDLFHIGHLNIIKRAKEYGDIIIVGVSSDDLVFKYKKIYPIIPLEQRSAILESLSCVDFVITQHKLAHVALLKNLNIDVFVTGDDWLDKKEVPEGYSWIKENLEMIFLPRTLGVSSTTIKKELNTRDLL